MDSKLNAFFFNPPIQDNWIGHIFSEVFKDKIFAPFVEGKKDLIILDVGGNIGITTYYFAPFAKQIYTVEPSTEHLATLSKMVDFNGLDNVKIIPKALYIENGRFPFGGPANNKTMRSLHTATWQDGKPEEEVETITLEELFKQEGIEHVDLMKLDIEGSEVEVASHPSFKAVANKIDTIVMEYHDWSGRNPNQMREALKNAGFEVSQMPSDAHILVAKRIK